MTKYTCPECGATTELPEAPEGVKAPTPMCGLVHDHPEGTENVPMVRAE